MREVCNVSEREGGQGKLPFRGLDWTGTIWQKGELDIYSTVVAVITRVKGGGEGFGSREAHLSVAKRTKQILTWKDI